MTAAFLSDDDCKEMVEHCGEVWREYGVKCNDGLPRLSLRSAMVWCPVATRVCLFPLKEGVNEGDDLSVSEVSGKDPHRPLFYSEVCALRIKELRKRMKQRKAIRKKRGLGNDASPTKPKRRLSF